MSSKRKLNQLPTRTFVIITKNIDGLNPDEEPRAHTLNQAVEYIGSHIIFYETHVAGLELLVAFNHAVKDEETVRTLALLELQSLEGQMTIKLSNIE